MQLCDNIITWVCQRKVIKGVLEGKKDLRTMPSRCNTSACKITVSVMIPYYQDRTKGIRQDW